PSRPVRLLHAPRCESSASSCSVFRGVPLPASLLEGKRYAPPEARALPRRWSHPSSVSCRRQSDRQQGSGCDDVRSTARAATMARRARHRSLRAFPAEAPLTPGTLDQERALPQPYELRAQLTILRLESEKLSDPCVSLSHESSIRSFPTRPHTSTNLSTVP